MKYFSVKDFIFYNNPCINCSQNNSLYLICVDSEGVAGTGITAKSPTVIDNKLFFDLEIKYKSHVSLIVDTKNNKFSTNNEDFLESVTQSNSFFLRSLCDCGTTIDSCKLIFNIKNKFVEPLILDFEEINISYVSNKETVKCKLFTDYHNPVESSELTLLESTSPRKIPLPLMTLKMFKNKGELVKKIKNIINFS